MLQAKKLTTPAQHGKYLHHNGKGYAILANKTKETWKEIAVPISDIEKIATEYAEKYDIYLTQNRFWKRKRRITHLAELNALFVDLDYYKKPHLALRDPEHIFEMAMTLCEEERVPSPSLAVSTGRGIALTWKHSSLPRKALPRWNACQKNLVEILKPLESDSACKDACRVLRLVGTKNSKSKQKVKTLYMDKHEWCFDNLADEILPLTREELNELREKRNAERANKEEKKKAERANKEEKKKKEKPSHLSGYNLHTLWEARLSDLQLLADIRHYGQLPPGHRDRWLFIASVAMSWITFPEMLEREIIALAAQAADWTENEARGNMGSVIRKAHAAAQGMKNDYGGREVDPRYHFKTETIIDWLDISKNEQEQLQVIISPEIAKERKAQKERRRREENGAISREQYIEKKENRKKSAKELKLLGYSNAQIAEKLEVHRNTVYNYLK